VQVAHSLILSDYNRRVRLIAAALLTLTPALVTAQPLVITAPAAPGGGWDQTARAMQRALAESEPARSAWRDSSRASGVIPVRCSSPAS
jgi:tripartite-type tricarboxylate transporter receptor subunit TctC